MVGMLPDKWHVGTNPGLCASRHVDRWYDVPQNEVMLARVFLAGLTFGLT